MITVLMSDVSCKVIISHFQFAEVKGLPEEKLLGLLHNAYPDNHFLLKDYLLRPSNRLPWASFTQFCEVYKGLFRPGWEEEFIDYITATGNHWMTYLTNFVGLVSSPAQIYRAFNLFEGPRGFGGVIVANMREIDWKHIEVKLEIRDGYEDNPMFFQISRWGMQKVPTLFGLAESKVETEFLPRAAVYKIQMPPSNSIYSRVARSFRLLFRPDKVLAELALQDEEVRKNYEEMVLKKEKENQQLEERLTHLQKMKAIGTLAGGIAHELNNVLQGVTLSLEQARQFAPSTGPLLEKLALAQKFADRGQNIVKQVLTFSRYGRTAMQSVEIVPVVQEAVELLRSMLPKTVQIQETYELCDSASTFTYADPTQLQQLIMNLGSNSAHAMRERGGHLKISVYHRMSGASARPVGFTLKIEDTGEGMDEELQRRVFEPFFTTKPPTQGTGMGLAVVHGIVKNHHGEIELTSQPGQGATFTIHLPISESETSTAVVTEEWEPGVEDSHVLIVDDEKDLLGILCETVESAGYRVTGAGSAKEALSLLKDPRSDFDVILTDLCMPEVDGIDFIRDVRQANSTIPIVICSGRVDSTHVPEDAETLGISRVLAKPIDGASLHRELYRVLGQSKSSSESPLPSR